MAVAKANSRKRNTAFDQLSQEPFRISRSKLDLFTECPRCAFLEMRLGVKRPSIPAFTLNNAVDELLKREFDTHRSAKSKHPLLNKYGIDAVPLDDDRIEEWRDALRRGISYLHKPTNIQLRGGIDDIWVTSTEEFIIVDYKATSKKVGPTSEDDLYDQYKRQMEIYQWLFRQSGFIVSSTGYFVYVNGRSDAEAFDGKLEFDVALIPYTGSDAWVEPKLFELKEMLMSDDIPPIGISFGGGPCDYCTYRESAGKSLIEQHKKLRVS